MRQRNLFVVIVIIVEFIIIIHLSIYQTATRFTTITPSFAPPLLFVALFFLIFALCSPAQREYTRARGATSIDTRQN
jgi:flagellar biosynthesis protein FliQ